MVMYKHAKQDAPSISELVDTVHPAMTHLVATLLQKDRARRPSSAATVIGYIDAIDWASDDVPVLNSESLDGSLPEDTEEGQHTPLSTRRLNQKIQPKRRFSAAHRVWRTETETDRSIRQSRSGRCDGRIECSS